MSNQYPAGFTIDGKYYKTNEHWFQSQKFKEEEWAEKIRNAKTGTKALQLGRSRNHPMKDDWRDFKLEIMLKGIRAKFEQNKDLAKMLLDTGDAEIAEHTKLDDFWADGGDGKG